MAAHALHAAILRLLTVCMIVVVGLHAFAPIGTPLERRAGSAFSAETSDVSLAGKRKIAAQKAAVAAPDGGRSIGDPLPALQPVALPLPHIAAQSFPTARPPPAPPLTITPRPFGPRGPPLS